MPSHTVIPCEPSTRVPKAEQWQVVWDDARFTIRDASGAAVAGCPVEELYRRLDAASLTEGVLSFDAGGGSVYTFATDAAVAAAVRGPVREGLRRNADALVGASRHARLLSLGGLLVLFLAWPLIVGLRWVEPRLPDVELTRYSARYIKYAVGLTALAGLAGAVACARGLREQARVRTARNLLAAAGGGNGPSGDLVLASRAETPGSPVRRGASPALARAAVALAVVVGLLSLWGVIIAFDRTVDTVAVLGGHALPDDAFERGLAGRPILTLLNVVPGMLFMALGPFQFVKKIRSRHIRLHRWCGRVWVVSAVLAGVTALIMGIAIGYGGPNETVAVTLFSLLFLYFVGKGYVHIRRREVPLHREWMIRAFAAGLAISSMRRTCPSRNSSGRPSGCPSRCT